MGCLQSALISPPAMSPDEIKKRRADTVTLREKYEERASKITPPANVNLCVEVEPWIAAPDGMRGVDDALATFQRGSHTSTREINMALSGMVSVDNNYDYKKSVVLSLKSKASGDVISAALFCEHNMPGGMVVELIWFVTQRKMEDKKYGSVLFKCMRDLARMAGAKALLVTSTPQATGFWLKHMMTLKESEKFSSNVIRSTKLDRKMDEVPKNLSERRRLHFAEFMRRNPPERKPGADVRGFYAGSGSSFTGKPYRYSPSSCSHIWFKVLAHNSKPLLSRSGTSNASSGSARSQSSTGDSGAVVVKSPSRGPRRSKDRFPDRKEIKSKEKEKNLEKERKERRSRGTPQRKTGKVDNPLTP